MSVIEKKDVIKVKGFSQEALVAVCQKVSAWNGGKVVSVILPNGWLEKNYGDKYMVSIHGYEVMEYKDLSNSLIEETNCQEEDITIFCKINNEETHKVMGIIKPR